MLPPTVAFPVKPGVSAITLTMLVWPVGSARSTSSVSTFCCRAFCVSTSGVSPVTVIVSASDPTARSALTVAVKPTEMAIPSRLYVLKPGSEKVTV